ncbi:MAG TPA: hypothetical protein VNJ05_05960 [Sphingomicrobium sp.]|nr:hypothetical protein [Sphingomicrobium sp.]
MRPTANFTVHAALAAALIALAATSAAAAGPPVIDNEGHVYLTFNLMGSAGSGDRGGQIEIDSYSWGETKAAGKQKVGPLASGGGANEISMDDTAGNEQMQPDGGDSAAGTGLQAESEGQGLDRPTFGEKFMSQMTKMGSIEGGIAGAGTEPPPRGTLSVKVKVPWLACAEGREFLSLQLSDGARQYVLRNVTVAGCGASGGPEESITFVYGKLDVRGWDPKVKQQVTAKAEPK